MRLDVEIANPQAHAAPIAVEGAPINPGASRTTIPRSLAERLDLEVVGKVKVRTLDPGTGRLTPSELLPL